MLRYGPFYVYFKGKCIKAHDTNKCYAPNESLKYDQISGYESKEFCQELPF